METIFVLTSFFYAKRTSVRGEALFKEVVLNIELVLARYVHCIHAQVFSGWVVGGEE